MCHCVCWFWMAAVGGGSASPVGSDDESEPLEPTLVDEVGGSQLTTGASGPLKKGPLRCRSNIYPDSRPTVEFEYPSYCSKTRDEADSHPTVTDMSTLPRPPVVTFQIADDTHRSVSRSVDHLIICFVAFCSLRLALSWFIDTLPHVCFIFNLFQLQLHHQRVQTQRRAGNRCAPGI